MKKNRDLSDVVASSQDLSTMERHSMERRAEVSGLNEKMHEQIMQLEDQKVKYRQLKQKCQELE